MNKNGEKRMKNYKEEYHKFMETHNSSDLTRLLICNEMVYVFSEYILPDEEINILVETIYNFYNDNEDLYNINKIVRAYYECFNGNELIGYNTLDIDDNDIRDIYCDFE